jgi:hypothetical protein
MLQAEACQLARADHVTLATWIGATPAAQKGHRSPEIHGLVDYYWHLDSLLHRCADGFSSAHGYAATLSEEALKHWGQNAHRSAN